MTQDQLSVLKDSGVDTIAAVNRFCGNLEMYQKFLLKFLDDKSCDNLMAALKGNDYDAAILHAHSLKGVSGNLGFTDIFDLSSHILDKLRIFNYEDVREDTKKLTFEYHKVIKAINYLKNGI